MNRELKFMVWDGQLSGPFTIPDIKLNDQISSGAIYLPFTGCCDREGNEIYEGYILSVPCLRYGQPSELREVVTWCDHLQDDMGQYAGYETSNFSQGVVIGNIYETPDRARTPQ